MCRNKKLKGYIGIYVLITGFFCCVVLLYSFELEMSLKRNIDLSVQMINNDLEMQKDREYILSNIYSNIKTNTVLLNVDSVNSYLSTYGKNKICSFGNSYAIYNSLNKRIEIHLPFSGGSNRVEKYSYSILGSNLYFNLVFVTYE